MKCVYVYDGDDDDPNIRSNEIPTRKHVQTTVLVSNGSFI